ncbi:MAG TPA: alpha/beta fold hydrolase [Acidimicrobiales bacterium]|nr:alpha/beta fold hydrolase [Acidimicrobiales bacterium]
MSAPNMISMSPGIRTEPVRIVATALRRPETYRGYARETLNTARCALLYPFGMLEAALHTGQPRGDAVHDTPVLLVHGYGHNRSGWFLVERLLRDAGFTSVHTMNYVAFGREGVPELARRLAARVAEIQRLTGAEKVHVVGHSNGGVLIRWFIQELGGDEVVDTAITVASPHEGTVAALVAPGPCARDLRPGSNVMRRLAIGARPMPVRWIAFYSNLDALVVPAPSAKLRAPALHATNILVKDHGHIGMMVSPKVARSIVAQLEAAETGEGSVLPLQRSDAGAPRRRPASEGAASSEVS